MNFYEPAPHPQDLRQGDVVGPVPFFALDLSTPAEILLPGQENSVIADLESPQPPGAAAVLPVTWALGVIITQCCDLDRKDRPIFLAYVLDFAKLHRSAATPTDVVNQIKNYTTSGKNPSKFYLPPDPQNPSMARGVADLLLTVSLAPQSRDKLIALRKSRMTASARQALQERLAYCFGRFGAPDDLYFASREEYNRAYPPKAAAPNA